MGDTSIEWTDKTWNPVKGCSPVSPGCKNCYAERQAGRFCGKGKVFEGFVQIGKNGNSGPHWTGKVELAEKHLEDPLHWKSPKRIFVNSMSDLFHEKLDTLDLARVFAVMAYCQWHDFQVLTKRAAWMYAILTARSPEREEFRHIVIALLQKLLAEKGPPPHPKPFRWPLPNVWLGVSVEDRANKDRIDLLVDTPAAIRFLSIEPLLEDIGELKLCGIDWVIVGGESGPRARPMHPAWVRNVRDQCQSAAVPFFFKQWGAWAPDILRAGGDLGGDVRRGHSAIVHAPGNPEGYFRKGDVWMSRVGKKTAGALLDGREYREFPNPQCAETPVQRKTTSV
jgi:protein gp37